MTGFFILEQTQEIMSENIVNRLLFLVYKHKMTENRNQWKTKRLQFSWRLNLMSCQCLLESLSRRYICQWHSCRCLSSPRFSSTNCAFEAKNSSQTLSAVVRLPAIKYSVEPFEFVPLSCIHWFLIEIRKRMNDNEFCGICLSDRSVQPFDWFSFVSFDWPVHFHCYEQCVQ